MQARLWLSGRCFECCVERIEPAADGAIVKTTARRYFRFDAASTDLLRRLMGPDAPDLDQSAHADLAAFVQRRLVPLGLYVPAGAPADVKPPRSTTGTMRWQRPLLAAGRVRPLAAALAPLFAPWLLWPLMVLCLWLHGRYALTVFAQIGYRDLLTFAPHELLLLVVVAVVRGALHELGHAAACWRLTRSVGAIGFGVFMATPVLYCDVSDIHMLPRRKKAWVGLAGTAMDVLALALLIGVAGQHPGVMKVYGLSVVAVLLNLVPFYRNDGYWVLNDLAGTSDLLKQGLRACAAGRASAREWAMVVFTAGCMLGIVALGAAFALEFGPRQVAEAAQLMPAFPGVMLAIVTWLQYAALVFGLLTGTQAVLRLLRPSRSAAPAPEA